MRGKFPFAVRLLLIGVCLTPGASGEVEPLPLRTPESEERAQPDASVASADEGGTDDASSGEASSDGAPVKIGATEEERSGPRLHPMFRVTLDHSRLHWLRDHLAEVDTVATAGLFREREMENTSAWGGRVRGGAVLAAKADQFGLQMYLEGAYSRTRRLAFGRTLAGEVVEWESRPSYWAAMTGAEAQLLRRILGLGLGVGVAGVVDNPSPTVTGLSVEKEGRWGFQGELSVGAHLPDIVGFHPGLEIFAAGFLLPQGPFAPGAPNRGTRVGISLFLEWDGSR